MKRVEKQVNWQTDGIENGLEREKMRQGRGKMTEIQREQPPKTVVDFESKEKQQECTVYGTRMPKVSWEQMLE